MYIIIEATSFKLKGNTFYLEFYLDALFEHVCPVFTYTVAVLHIYGHSLHHLCVFPEEG